MTSDLLKTTLATLARHRHRVWQHASNPAVRADDSMFLQVRAAYFAVLSIACSQKLISEDEMEAFEAWGRQSEPDGKLRMLFKTHGVDIENPDDPVSKSEMLQLHIKNLQAQNTRLREDLTRERGEAAAERQTYIERLAGVIQERDKATAMLAEALRERDELMVILEDERARVILGKMEIDELRAKLERVRKVQRWELEATDSRYMVRSEDGRYVHHAHIAAIIGKDGEA